jgi:hypothetical protein
MLFFELLLWIKYYVPVLWKDFIKVAAVMDFRSRQLLFHEGLSTTILL